MKKIFLITISLIICGINLSAQKKKDVVYLKNGSIIYGTVVEITASEYKIRTKDGSLFVFSPSEVDKYVKESPLFDGRKKNGLGFALEAGLLLGSQESSEYPAPFSFNTIVSYTYDTKNDFGIGTGAEFLGKTFTPLFFEYRRIINDRRATPFFFVRTGMLLYLGSQEGNSDYIPQYGHVTDYHGGPSFSAGTGISWAGEDVETYLLFAYRYAQTSRKEVYYNEQETSYTTYWNRLELKFGFKF